MSVAWTTSLAFRAPIVLDIQVDRFLLVFTLNCFSTRLHCVSAYSIYIEGPRYAGPRSSSIGRPRLRSPSRLGWPILFYLLIILFDGSGDINFSYCFVFTFVFRLFFLLLLLLRCFTDALHDGCKHLRSSHCLQRARHFSYNFYFSFVVFPP